MEKCDGVHWNHWETAILSSKVIWIWRYTTNINCTIFKGVDMYCTLSLLLTDTFFPEPNSLTGLHLTFTPPQVNLLHQPQNCPFFSHQHREKKEQWGEWHIERFRVKEKYRRRGGGHSPLRFKDNLSPFHPFTSCHTGPLGNGSCLSLMLFTCQSECYRIQWASCCGAETPSLETYQVKSAAVYPVWLTLKPFLLRSSENRYFNFWYWSNYFLS